MSCRVEVHDPETTPEPPLEALQRWFALSRVEAQLALSLTLGQSPSEIADARGVSIATIRTQLRSLFTKTQTRGQSDLVRLLARLSVG